MKKALLLGCMMVSVVANAEVFEFMGGKIEYDDNGIKITQPNGQVFGLENGKSYLDTGNDEVGVISSEVIDGNKLRFGIGGIAMDMQQDPNDPNTILMSDPDGNVVRKMKSTVDANGNEVIQFLDADGNVTSQATKGENGGTGFINEMFPDGQSLNMQIENGEMVSGSANLVGKKYKKDLRMNRGAIEIIIKDAASNKVICKVQSSNDYSRAYDAAGKLIAEGADEENPKIYDQKAFDECERALDEDDDD